MLGGCYGLCYDEDLAWARWRAMSLSVDVEVKVPFSERVGVLGLYVFLDPGDQLVKLAD